MKNHYLIGVICLVTFIFGCGEPNKFSYGSSEWLEYLGGPERNHFSPLTQINLENVSQLKIAWEYHTGDTGQIQANPIIVDGVLYSMTATAEPFALNASTGEEIWRIPGDTADQFNTSRGLTYWKNDNDKRILYTTGEWLYAVEAHTGKSISSFGDKGRVSLKSGLGETAKDKMVISNTPGTIYEDLIIMPLRVSEGHDAALGHIQAFNVITGTLEWVFETIPSPGQLGYDTWPKDSYKNTEVGGGNNWAGMAVDRDRGIIYVPTGSSAFDFYGANRTGANLFTDCLLALDGKTGKLIWHFQFVHHDILDRDPPAPPNLITVKRDGKNIDAVAQITKQGYVFVFDRENGNPLFPIHETPVPVSDIPGEQSWPTQPIPEKPAPYARQTLTEDDISPLADDRDELLTTLRSSRYEGPFTPLSRQGTIIYPGLDGGAEWGGAAVDPNGIMYVNSSEMAWHISLNPSINKEVLKKMTKGQSIYALNCTPCHGEDLKGNPKSGFPSLVSIEENRSKEVVKNTIVNGKGMMPAFKLSNDDQKVLIDFLFGDEKTGTALKDSGLENKNAAKSVYSISGYTKFLDKNGYPAIRPPWGTLNAINLNTGEYVWKITYGEYPELMAKGIPQTGSESYGGPIITQSGLLFIAGTKDSKFRAYEMKTGKLVWETILPAAAFATPSTYEKEGKQYVVIACGGTKLGAEGGDSYVAYALPD